MAVREMKMIPDEIDVVSLALLGLRIGVEVGDGNSVSVKLPQRNVFLFSVGCMRYVRSCICS